MDYESCSSEKFTNFNFAQAIVKILDNMGFSAATPDALEVLTGIMRKYFEDLCKRTAFNKELG
jgi:glycerol-3-phosphate responsive antiterminator